MMDILRDYIWETDEDELHSLIDSGYEIIYQDISLSVIYEEIASCFENHEIRQRISEMFGYYGLSVLLQVDGMNYWLMQS